MTEIARFLNLGAWLLSIILTVAIPNFANSQNACSVAFADESRGDELNSAPTRFDDVAKLVSSPDFESPARLVVTKFAGHRNFQSSTSQSWTFNGKEFEQGRVRQSKQVGASENESIFAEQQDFSLAKMVETGYLSARQAELFRRQSLKRAPGQITFLEMVHDATRAEIEKFYSKYPGLRIGGSHTQDYNLENSRAVKTAALYSAGGQIWRKSGEVKHLPLPWEEDETRKSHKLDRNRYKYVWEWGRSGQDRAGEIAPLYAANAIQNYIELRAYGGSLDDAYITAHSFDKRNSRLFLRMAPNSLYPKDWADNDDALFLLPLRDALKIFRPSSVSERVATLIRLSDGKLTDLDALDLLIDCRLWRWNELDFKSSLGPQPSPIILNDMSNGRSGFILLQLQAKGLDPDASDRTAEYLLSLEHILHSVNEHGKYEHAADSLVTSYTYHHANGVEISNLDPTIAAKDPYYAGSVLMSAFSYYMDQIARTISQTHHLTIEESYPHAAKWLTSNPMVFGVTAATPDLERQLQKLQPTQVIQAPGNPNHKTADKPYQFRDARLYLFSASHIRHLILMHPDFYNYAGHGLSPGVWRSHYLTTQPDFF